MLDARIIKRRRAGVVDVHLRVARGERVAMFGPSGAGKSTILSCIAGLEIPDGGSIVLEEMRLFPPSAPLYRRPIGYLTQKDLLFPHLSVGENVCFGLDERATRETREWIDELRKRLDIAAVWNASAAHISGGQARRVALARALARRPRLMLLDEPCAGLDRATARLLIEALTDWQAELGYTTITVDHRPDVLERLSGRVLALVKGRIVQDGTFSEVSSHAATAEIADLLDMAR